VARRPSKRTNFLPDLTGDPSDDPRSDGLKIEIAIRKGALGEYPFPNEVRDDLNELLNVDISNVSWYEIKAVTARYMLRASHFHISSNTATVRTACQDLIGAIDQLKQAYDRHAGDSAIARFLRNSCIDVSVQQLAGFDRAILMKEIENCAAKTKNVSGPGWDEWIRDLARICPKIGIASSGAGPERSKEDQSSKFVRLVSRLQSELPEVYAEHELDSKSSEASFAKAVRRALSSRVGVPGAKANIRLRLK
jgi:hypothetical protein